MTRTTVKRKGTEPYWKGCFCFVPGRVTRAGREKSTPIMLWRAFLGSPGQFS